MTLRFGRWGRAARLLGSGPRSVLDAGCAFGFGSAMLRATGRMIAGVEGDAAYVARARREQPWLPIVRGDVTRLPFADAVLDAVVCLDVLEHVANPAAACGELRRVLRPGGAAVISVPYDGLLGRWDSLNVYSRLAARAGWSPIDPTERGHPDHRHFTLAELAALLEGFVIERVERTGLGISEPVNLLALVVCRGLMGNERLYRLTRLAYFAAALLEDPIPGGRLAYNLTVLARKSGTITR